MVTEHSKKKELLDKVESFLKLTDDTIGSDTIQLIKESMDSVDRKYFVSPEHAYRDMALPIGNDQTISQPSTVARMLSLLEIQQNDNVLEIGSGSGWNAALLGYCVYPGTVKSIDRIPDLVAQAEKNLSQCKEHAAKSVTTRLSNVTFETQDAFSLEKTDKNKYSKIMFTAGIQEHQKEKIRELCQNHLTEEGKAICPRSVGPMLIFEKRKGKIHEQETDEQYQFVPLIQE